MVTSNLSSLISSLYEVRQQKAVLDKTEKAILSQLCPIIDGDLDKLERSGEKAAVGVGSFSLLRVSGISRTISGDKLLERGVAPDIVAYATKTVTYHQYRVKKESE